MRVPSSIGFRRAWILLGVVGAVSCATNKETIHQKPPFVLEEHAEPDLVDGDNSEAPSLPQRRHKVEPGQNLFRIAKSYGLTTEQLAAANGIEDSQSITVGQELVIPIERSTFARSSQRISLLPRVGKPDGTLQWPLRGVLYARFGKKGKEPHDGIDLAAPLGTPVKTAAEGTVLYAGEQPGYGQIVIVQHAEGLVTLYAHNHDLRVKTGQKVRTQQVIATVGESGKTSGPHLHFEVRRAGVPIDPLEELGPIPRS